MNWRRWGNPRHKPIADCKVKELARKLLLHLIDLLEQRGDSPEAMEQAVGFFREESIGGLNYHTMLLEEKLEIPKEERTHPIGYNIPKKEALVRVKRLKRVKKDKSSKRGELFG